MKKYAFTFLGLSLLVLLSGCNTTPNKNSNAQSKSYSTSSSELTTTSEPAQTNLSRSFSDIQETSSTTKEKEYDSSTDDNQGKKITSITETQKETLIAFTQQDCEDRGYKLKYRGKDTWNVAVNYINNKNRWIVTCNDANYGRVKAIYEWDGDENSGATLIYLLISGNELINNLNN